MAYSVEELKVRACNARKSIVEMITEAKSGHPGGSLSIVDILTTLYFNEMNIDPKNPKDENRDRFVLSKGHSAPALYSVLAERGFFDKKELNSLRQINSKLQGHPNMNLVEGIDMSTGSLGQGISTAVGMALAGILDKKDYNVFTILGDGELEEGQVWEAAMCAGHYKLDKLIAFVDYNTLQIDGRLSEVVSPEPITDKFAAFNWNVVVIDGHNYDEIAKAIKEAKEYKGKPTVIVANTTKGKGVSFMEDEAGWHGAAPSAEQCKEALNELGGIK